MNSNQQVIIEMKSGTKCEGLLVSIDKEKMLIKLSNAKRTMQSEDGKTKEETFLNLDIAKDEIKEVKIVQFESFVDQDLKKGEAAQSDNLNAIPQNLQNCMLNNQDQGKIYDKTDSFFDALKPMTNKDAQYESFRYNDKNCETFDLPKNAMNGGNFDGSYGNRGRGARRGGNRGGYRRGYQNYNNNYSNNNNNYNQNPNNNFYNNNHNNGISMEYPNNNANYNRQGQNFRGGNRGGDQNFNYNNNLRNNYNNNNNSNFSNDAYSNYSQSNYSKQFQHQAQTFGNPYNSGNFPMNGQMQQQSFDSIRGNFGNFQRGRAGQNRGFGGNNYRGRGGNRNYDNNKITNSEFNSINENSEANNQLDDDYSLSIYDKLSSSNAFASRKPNTQNLSAYDPNAEKN
jgi:small nuclear ribonucleoprotein (snRNP)-like protein